LGLSDEGYCNEYLLFSKVLSSFADGSTGKTGSLVAALLAEVLFDSVAAPLEVALLLPPPHAANKSEVAATSVMIVFFIVLMLFLMSVNISLCYLLAYL
jgi:hypothetical protein